MTIQNLTPGLRAAMAAGRYFEKKDADPIKAIMEKIAEHTKAVADRLGKSDAEIGELGETVTDLSKRLGAKSAPEQSWGQQVIDTKGLGRLAGERGAMTIEIKEVTTAPASGGALGRPHQDRNIATIARPRLVVRDLLPVIPISEGSVDYVRQTERATNADTVAEGAIKPESNIAYTLENMPAQVIAHWIRASRQALEDLPQLRGLVDNDLLFGLREKEDDQLLNGNGNSPNINGIIPQATAFSPEAGIVTGTPNMIDTLGLAILQNALAEYPADGIVVHPADWMHMRMLKDGEGHYILGDPGSNPDPILFGLPVVATKGVRGATSSWAASGPVRSCMTVGRLASRSRPWTGITSSATWSPCWPRNGSRWPSSSRPRSPMAPMRTQASPDPIRPAGGANRPRSILNGARIARPARPLHLH